MSPNTFTWCDLSTFDLTRACDFYGNVFGWSAHDASGSAREGGYTLLYADSEAAAGIYTMPEFFQSIRMPSFWMSYVRVESLEPSVDLAVKLGAKCEIQPTPFDEQSRFALTRDPSGAGFTLYEGPDLRGRDNQGQHGRMIWNELHVPSLDLVEPFYRELFDWDIAPDAAQAGRRNINSPSGEPVASILQLDEQTKGPKNYWAVVFAADSLEATLETVAANGGTVLMAPNAETGFAMANDDQGAMFCISDTGIR